MAKSQETIHRKYPREKPDRQRKRKSKLCRIMSCTNATSTAESPNMFKKMNPKVKAKVRCSWLSGYNSSANANAEAQEIRYLNSGAHDFVVQKKKRNQKL